MSVTLHTTLGDLKVEVYCKECPLASENFLALAARGTYDGNKLHRVIKGFLVQGGDPTGTGKGGESIWGEKFKDEIRPTLRHNSRGVLAMANNGPDSNGSQFFITFGKHVHLDGKYTVFGRVLDGWDSLDKIEDVEVDKKNRPKEPIYIKGVTIHANPIADK